MRSFTKLKPNNKIQTISVSVVGATGYTGEELVRILARHPRARLTYVSGREDRGVKIQEIFPDLRGKVDLSCRAFAPGEAAKADLVFLCLPHTVSMQHAPFFLSKGKKVIDVSADYRLTDPASYERHYKTPHRDAANLKEAVYGLTELYRDRIKGARFVANPGCYPTAALLGLWPLIKAGVAWDGAAVIDAKSGVTGAGRKAAAAMLFGEVNEDFRAYRAFNHQHEPEILQEIRRHSGGEAVFVPHLLPVNRGILASIYLRLKAKTTASALHDVVRSTYAREAFVSVLPEGGMPRLAHVRHTNQCHIGTALHADGRTAAIFAAIDNLGKGAAGQAAQNMNLMCGFEETDGLL